jgi:hypothetical protein
MTAATLAVARQTGPSPFCYSETQKIGTKAPQVNAEPQVKARGGCGATPRRCALPDRRTGGKPATKPGPNPGGGTLQDQRSNSSKPA